MAEQRYHVIERIDAGGMAEVFKANSTSLQGFEKLVAIKRILPNLTKNERFVRMFLDEAKVSLHLNHTNCVQVFDLGLANGTYFIVMEFVDGTNLKNIIERISDEGRTMPPEEAAFIALEICKGLAHAHSKKDQKNQHLSIVHRDISPPNILLSREGEVKITDFGLAKAKSQVETTDPGIVKGKFGYLSPEAAHGEEVDARTDIFAIGILMWEMLTGERLFLGETDVETLQQVRKNKVPALEKYRNDVPPEFEKIIRKALHSDIEVRYQSARELGQSLAEFLFAFGKPVTSFDLAKHVRQIREEAQPRVRTEKEKAVEEAVQQAVNQIVSLEEIDDLDLHLAQAYSTMDSEASEEWDGEGDFEDPRMWGDFGFDEAGVSIKEASVGEEDWAERNLDEVMRRRQTHPGGVPAAMKTTKQAAAGAPRAGAARPSGAPPVPTSGDEVPLHQRTPAKPGPRNSAKEAGANPKTKPSERSVEVNAEIGDAEYRPAPAKPPASTTSEMRAHSDGQSTFNYILIGLVVFAVLLAIGALIVILT